MEDQLGQSSSLGDPRRRYWGRGDEGWPQVESGMEVTVGEESVGGLGPSGVTGELAVGRAEALSVKFTEEEVEFPVLPIVDVLPGSDTPVSAVRGHLGFAGGISDGGVGEELAAVVAVQRGQFTELQDPLVDVHGPLDEPDTPRIAQTVRLHPCRRRHSIFDVRPDRIILDITHARASRGLPPATTRTTPGLCHLDCDWIATGLRLVARRWKPEARKNDTLLNFFYPPLFLRLC